MYHLPDRSSPHLEFVSNLSWPEQWSLCETIVNFRPGNGVQPLAPGVASTGNGPQLMSMFPLDSLLCAIDPTGKSGN